jgi:hypothetical protein
MKVKTYFFKPISKIGLIVHGVAIILLMGVVSMLIIPLFNHSLSFLFIAYLLSAFLVAIPIPFLAYRTYALFNAEYILERDGIRLKWGLRLEDIPMNEILWVQQAKTYPHPIHYPFFQIPGALLGQVKQPNGEMIEFIASEKKNLVLIGLKNKIYAVSPLELEKFLTVFTDQLEYGSLAEIIPQSIYPSLLVTQIFKLPKMIWLMSASFILNLVLLFASGFASTRFEQVFMSYNVLGMLEDPIPATQLMIFPILSLFFFFSSIILSIVLYRDQSKAKLIYLLQLSNILSCLLFIFTLIRILLIS